MTSGGAPYPAGWGALPLVMQTAQPLRGALRVPLAHSESGCPLDKPELVHAVAVGRSRVMAWTGPLIIVIPRRAVCAWRLIGGRYGACARADSGASGRW